MTRTARLLFRTGNAPSALADAERAVAAGSKTDNEPDALHILALIQASVGRRAEARRTIDKLAALAKIGGPAEARWFHWASGEVARLEGDTTRAIKELRTAVETLSPHGNPIGPPTQHTDLLFSAAQALVEGGFDKEEVPHLERIQAGFERINGLESWARSFYVLGQIYERAGDQARAREQYRRFVELWGDGDMERDWVSQARQKLQK
jgi:tetratricopeptide (TPR) repeat protein